MGPNQCFKKKPSSGSKIVRAKDLKEIINQLDDEEEIYVIKVKRKEGVMTPDLDIERVTDGCNGNSIGWVLVDKSRDGVKH